MMASPVGLLFVASTTKGLRYVEFMDRKSLKRVIASHEKSHPDASWDPSLLELKPVIEQLESYFNGGLVEFDLPLDLAGTEFQVKAWKALLEIPFGEKRTYGQLAKQIRQPRATRAVGLANNQNPIAIVVPCHRVVGANGSLTGYGGGLPKKRWLLDHEATHARRLAGQGDLFVGAGREGTRRPSR